MKIHQERCPLIRINRIFWKIFFLFWISNALIVLGVVVAVFLNIQSEGIRDKQKRFVTLLAENVIDAHENSRQIDPGLLQALSSKKELSSRNRDRPRKINMTIRDAHSDTIIFEKHSREKKWLDVEYEFTIHGDSDKAYVVYTFTGGHPKSVLHEFSKIKGVQFFLVFIISAFVSFLLSWMITSPLKKLGAYSRTYRSGSNNLDIDASLLSRGDEIGDLSRDFKVMAQHVEKNISDQKQLLHDVSHELRAPLSRLQTTAGIMQQQIKDDVYLDRIHLECDNINNLIQHILNFSRLDHGELNIQKIDLLDVLASEVDAVKYQYVGRNIRLKNDSHLHFVHVDSDILLQAFGNVLRNACKYTNDELPIDITVECDDSQVKLHIRDYGSGVNSAEIHHLVTPFYRSGNVMHSDGHGLGLSITNRAMTKIKGGVSIKNHPQGGLEVTLAWPLS